MSLARFGVDRSDLPINLADCIQQDSEDPDTRCPFGIIYRGSLRTTRGSIVKVRVTVSLSDGAKMSTCFVRLQLKSSQSSQQMTAASPRKKRYLLS